MTTSANLYDSIYTDDDDSDLGMIAINEMYGHLNFDEISNYISLQEYIKLFPIHVNKMISIFHFNIQSLEANLVHLEALLANFKQTPDIIALSETWLNENNADSFILEGYNSFHVVREPRKHGGVSLYVRNHLSCDKIEEFTYLNSIIEICTLKITINNENYTVAAIYRPDDKYKHIKEFRKELGPILKNPLFKKSKSIILGDINIDLLMHGEHKLTNEYLNMLQTFSYTPIITRATRFPQGRQLGTPSLLDHIFINFTPPSVSGILHHEITDHLPVFLNIHLPQPSNSLFTIKFRIFNQENEAKFTRKLAYTLWEEILTDPDIHRNFELFINHFQNIYDECFPIATKIVSSKRIEKPWLSTGLFNSIKNKNRMFKNFKLGLTSEGTYKRYKNKLVNLLKVAKMRYYKNLFNSFKTNTKKLWQVINSITNKGTKHNKVDNLIVKNKVLSNPSDISEAYNHFFVNAAKDLQDQLPKLETDFRKFMGPRNPISMDLAQVNLSEVTSIIHSLKSKKCRVNDFSPSILKRNSHLIAMPLTTLINQSFQQGQFPNKLKQAQVIPLYKKGARSDINNYRPISLLNVFSKVFEKAMKLKMVAFIDSHKILCSSQYGFQKKISTEDALIHFSKNIYQQLDQSNSVLSIFIDFSKAFDTVPHNILLDKLDHYGIRGPVKAWFADYLSDRSQTTVFENFESSALNCSLGVPQGSVLGPLLFLLFINDLPNVSRLLYTLLFADDATMSVCGKDPKQLIQIANNELHRFYLWCNSNKLTVNTLKTFFILFSNKRISNLPPLVIKSNLTYELIKQVDSTKFLGVYYDYDMTFKSHIRHLSQKLARTAALLYKVKSIMPEFVLKNMYHAHILSLLNYCNVIWSNTFPSHLDTLVKLQKRVIRTITNSDFIAHTHPLFQQSKILDIDRLRKFNLCVYFFKNKNLLQNQYQHGYPTRHRHRIRPERHSTTLYEHSFMYQANKVWNELLDGDTNVINALSLPSFKRQLKQYLLSC